MMKKLVNLEKALVVATVIPGYFGQVGWYMFHVKEQTGDRLMVQSF